MNTVSPDESSEIHINKFLSLCWQPIETAPKDRPILCYDPNQPTPVSVVECSTFHDKPYWITCVGEHYYIWNPTHWMDLPGPPTSD